MKAGWRRPFDNPIEISGRKLVALLDVGECNNIREYNLSPVAIFSRSIRMAALLGM